MTEAIDEQLAPKVASSQQPANADRDGQGQRHAGEGDAQRQTENLPLRGTEDFHLATEPSAR